jgi:ABC-type antimicrobial peptide transport system permease subunit
MGNEVGFDPRNLTVISLDPIRDGYSGEQAAAFFSKLLDRVKLIPSITAASLADSTPMAMMGKPEAPFSTNDAGIRKISSARKYVVGRDYFDTIGIPILRGRGFRKQDEASKVGVAIISERLAQLWKGEDPLGRLIEMGYEEVPRFQIGSPRASAQRFSGKVRQVLQVVGVARNTRDGVAMAASEAPSMIYLPMKPVDYARPSFQGLTLMVRSTPGFNAVGALRLEISALDSNVTPFNARSMPEQIDQMMYPVRLSIWTYGCIGLFGLILASAGLAGMTAYSVAQRGREIGIRMALGARKSDVLGLVMKEGAVLVSAGSLIGLAGAWGGQRVLSALVSQVAQTTGRSAADPLLLAGAPLLLAGLALVACYVPARKSMRIDPAVALRQE